MERFKEWLSEWMDYLSDHPAPPILLMAVLVWIAAFRFGFDRLEPGFPVLFAWLGLSSVAAVFVVLWVYRKPQEDREAARRFMGDFAATTASIFLASYLGVMVVVGLVLFIIQRVIGH